jgi:Rrf2 family transcriptional regulator, iron-sulfur cluster assembly transcription factor
MLPHFTELEESAVILGTKARYGVTAMVALAAKNATTTLSDLADTQGIPLPYLEQIFAKLKKAGLVEAVRGPGGGYTLARASGAIRIADIVDAAEESIKMTRCGEATSCVATSAKCLTHDLWEGLEQHIHGYLSGLTLADICAPAPLRQLEKTACN